MTTKKMFFYTFFMNDLLKTVALYIARLSVDITYHSVFDIYYLVHDTSYLILLIQSCVISFTVFLFILVPVSTTSFQGLCYQNYQNIAL